MLADKLGYNRSNTTDEAGHTADNAAYFSNSSVYYVNIKELKTNDDEYPYNCFGILYNNVNYNEELIYSQAQYRNKENKYNSDNDFGGNLTIEIRDEDNKLCDLNNSNYYLEILIE